MKNKDQIFLENAYSKILETHSDDFEKSKLETLSGTEQELSSSPIGKNIFEFMNKVKENYSIKDLLDFLNSKENWTAKDNLIQFLFQYYDKNN
jgi:Ca2+-binding EF-hand superfamily protein